MIILFTLFRDLALPEPNEPDYGQDGQEEAEMPEDEPEVEQGAGRYVRQALVETIFSG